MKRNEMKWHDMTWHDTSWNDMEWIKEWVNEWTNEWHEWNEGMNEMKWNEWMNEMNEWMNEMNEWMNGMNEWMTEWMNEWNEMNEWMNEMEWNGMEWNEMNEWMKWNQVNWNDMKWNEVKWNEWMNEGRKKEWMERNGMEWNEMNERMNEWMHICTDAWMHECMKERTNEWVVVDGWMILFPRFVNDVFIELLLHWTALSLTELFAEVPLLSATFSLSCLIWAASSLICFCSELAMSSLRYTFCCSPIPLVAQPATMRLATSCCNPAYQFANQELRHYCFLGAAVPMRFITMSWNPTEHERTIELTSFRTWNRLLVCVCQFFNFLSRNPALATVSCALFRPHFPEVLLTVILVSSLKCKWSDNLFACCQQLLQRDARTRGRPSLGDVCSHHTFKTAAIRALPLFHTQMHTLSECYLFFLYFTS